MSTRTALAYIRRGWIFVTALVVLSIVATSVLTLQRKAVYTATATGFVAVADASQRPPSTLTSGSLYILARTTSYAQLATTTAVLDSVAGDLQYPGGESALHSAITASAELNTPYIDVSVKASSGDLAARAANAVLAQLSKTIASYENGTIQLNVSNAATAPSNASNHKVALDAAIAGLAALLIGCAAAVGWGWLRLDGSMLAPASTPAVV